VDWIAARYGFDPAREVPITSLTTLRERKLSFFAVVCAEAGHIHEVLEASYRPPRIIDGMRGDDYSFHERGGLPFCR
jgi:hypothetical protein